MERFQPHPALRSYIRYYWYLDIQSSGESLLNLQVMTDRFPRVVIQCLQGKNALHSQHYSTIYPASLKGITSKPMLFQMEPIYSHVAVSFYPHGVKAFFGIDGYETVDTVLDLHHFFPTDVIEQIVSASNPRTRIKILENYLLKRLQLIKAIDCRVLNFLNLSPTTNYRRQLKDYGISERQFERKFLQSVGFTPSFYKRVVRFETALYKIQQGDYASLAELSYESGYADQSHFNREFKEFSSLTPLLLITTNKLLKESGSILAE